MGGLERFITDYRGLFSSGDSEEEDGDEDEDNNERTGGNIEYFRTVWGWHNSVENISKIEGVTMEAVYNFSAVRFLNAVSYLKAKQLFENEVNDRYKKKNVISS